MYVCHPCPQEEERRQGKLAWATQQVTVLEQHKHANALSFPCSAITAGWV